MKMSFVAILAIGLWHLAGSAHSQTYFKCTTESGKTDFSDKPCPANARADVLNQKANVLDNSGMREQALRKENEALKSRLEKSEKSRAKKAENTTESHAASSYECKTAQRDYEVATSSIKPNELTIEARRSAMFIACGTKEPKRKAASSKKD